MKLGKVDTKDQVIVIAEVGNNHGGNVDRARKMIDLAHESGADAVKFQTYLTEHYVLRAANEERFQNLKRWQLSHEDFDVLARHARDIGIPFLSTPFDLYSAKFLGENDNITGLKISSGDNTFYPLIEVAACSGKPLIISTGIADAQEIRRAVETVTSTWMKNSVNQSLALLHCVCSYPADPSSANLRAIGSLAETFADCISGYSDHTNDTEVCALATALGARIVERHFTDDRNSTEGPDHKISADPKMMVELVRAIKDAATQSTDTINLTPLQQSMLGDGVLGTLPCEAPLVDVVRRSTIAARDLKKGTRIERGMLSWVRPAGGVPPGQESTLIGGELNRDVDAGTLLGAEDMERA